MVINVQSPQIIMTHPPQYLYVPVALLYDSPTVPPTSPSTPHTQCNLSHKEGAPRTQDNDHESTGSREKEI